jgi:hypothetical protein
VVSQTEKVYARFSPYPGAAEKPFLLITRIAQLFSASAGSAAIFMPVAIFYSQIRRILDYHSFFNLDFGIRSFL